MSIEDFARLVLLMLAKQKEYFRLRNNTLLAESKDLERRVAKAANEILNPSAPGLYEGLLP